MSPTPPSTLPSPAPEPGAAAGGRTWSGEAVHRRSWWRRVGLRGRLYLLLTVTMLPAVLLAGLYLHVEWREDRGLADAAVRTGATHAIEAFQRHQQAASVLLGLLVAAELDLGRPADRDRLSRILSLQPDAISFVAVADRAGNWSVLRRGTTEPARTTSTVFQQAVRSDGVVEGPILSGPVPDPFDGQPTLLATQGGVVIGTHTDDLMLTLQSASRMAGARVSLLFPPFGDAAQPSTDGVQRLWSPGPGDDRLRVAQAVPGQSLRLQLEVPAVAAEQVSHLRVSGPYLTPMLLALLLGTLLGVRLLRSHHTEVRRLRDQVNAFAGSDAAASTHLRLSGDLGDLEDAFHRMANRIQAQRDELRAERELYLRLSRGAADWVWEQDSEFRFTRFQFLVEDSYFHMAPHSVLGKTRWELGYENMTAAMWKEHIEMLKAHKPFRNLILQRRNHDGSLHVVRASGDPQFDAQGQFVGYKGSGADITRAFQAETAVEMAERRWFAALESAGHAVWDWDVANNRIYRSATWGKMLGLGPEVDLQDPDLWARLVHPDDSAAAARALQAHVDGSAPRYLTEFRLRHVDGSWRWMLDRGMAVQFNPDGSPSRIIGTQTDITTEKEMGLELAESEQRLTTIFMNAALPMMIADVETRAIIRVNLAFERVLDLSAADVVGRQLVEFGVWHDPGTSDRLYEQLARDGSLNGVEVRMRGRSGRETDLLLFVDIVNLSGRQAIIAQGYDITEQKRATRDRDEAARWAKTLVDFSPAGMTLTRRSDGVIIEVNDSLCQLIEYSREELIGVPVREVGHWAHPEERVRAQQLFDSQESLRAFPVTVKTKSGKLREVLLYSELVVLDGVHYILSQANDVTELARTQQALAESEQRMKTIFMHGPIPMVLAELETQSIIQVNPALERVLGVPGEELAGKSLFEMGIWTNLDDRKRMYDELAKSGRVENLETRFRAPDGELVDYQISVEVIPYGGRRAIIAHGFDITANRRALNEAERSRRWFRTLFEQSPISMTILDMEGKTIMANAACSRMYGMPLDQIIGRTSGQNNLWANPGDRDRFWSTLQETGSIRDVVLARKRADGRTLHVLAYMDKFEIDGENYYITQGIDVSKAQESEQALRALTALNSAAFNAVGESIVVHDRDGKVILVNAMTERVFEAAGRPPLGATLLEPEFRWCGVDGTPVDADVLPFRVALHTGKPVREQVVGLQLPLTAGQLDTRWFSVSCEPIDHNGDGEFEGTVTSFFDITDRVRAEAELRVLLDRLQLQLERMPIACFLTDENFNVTYWNPASARMFGYTPDDILGRSAEILTPEDMRSTVDELVRGTLRNAAGVDFRNENLTSDGKRITCEWRSNPLYGTDGRFVATMHMAIDMTDVIESQRRLEMLNEELEQRVAQRTEELSDTVRELEQFSYTVAHDLRAPLRALDGYSSLLAEGGPESGLFLAKVRANVAHMTGLIDGLLNYGRIGRQALHRQPVNMNRLCEVVVADLKHAYPHAQVEVGPMQSVMGDGNLLRQVWTNLVSNACKFSSHLKDSRVQLWCEPVGHDAMRFLVRDNGVGFDMKYANKLFGVFERLHRQDEFSGSGIGLSIVKRIIERHGGTVGVESAPNKGTTFWFQLPVARDELAALPPSATRH